MEKQIKVPPLKVVFDENMRQGIVRDIDAILSSGMVASGPKTREFEEFWAAYCGTGHAVAVSNGGSALELIFKFLNVKGKDVLVPTNTFIATVNAVIAAGGNPVFMDTDRTSLCVSRDEIERRLTKNTAAVCVVHIGGIISTEMPAIAELLAKKGVPLVEDAAHAHGSETSGKRAGKYGAAAAYSFFSTKVITSTEGGMVATDNEELAKYVISARDYGKKSQWESVHTMVSMNYRMSEICAVIGLAQAKKLDEFIAYREKVAKKYISAFKDDLELILPEGRNSWYKFTFLLPKGMDRDGFKAKLKENGISASGGIYDLPVHLQPVFEPLGLKGKFPVAEEVCLRHVCLPVFYGMTDEQVDHVIFTVKRILGGK